MSTFINMAIKQVIKNDGLPFNVQNPKPNKELLEALKEGEEILREIKKKKPLAKMKKENRAINTVS